MKDLKVMPCPICGTQDSRTVYPDSPSRIVACRSCDLVFFNPLPSASYLSEYYSTQEGYLPSIEENLRSFEADPGPWRETAEAILAILRRHASLKAGSRVLDVGCAYGFFLHWIDKAGLDAHGLEISSATSAWARDQGRKVATGTLAEHPFEAGSFDAVTFNNVLEHSIEPLADLRQVHGLLKKKGLLFLAVPNFDSLAAKVDGYYWKMKSWPNHLFYFTESTLSRMAKEAGFEVLEAFTWQGESDKADDLRLLRERLAIDDDEGLEKAFRLICEQGRGQELVLVARRR